MPMPTSDFFEVQHDSNYSQTSSVAVTLGATATAGNLLVGYALSRFALTTPSGYTAITPNTTGHHSGMFWKISDGTETGFTVSSTSATAMVAGLAEYDGPVELGDTLVVTSSAQWYAPGGTITPAEGSLLVAVSCFAFRSITVLPWDSGNKTLPTPGSWTCGLKPSKTAHPSGLQGTGRPFVKVSGSSWQNALAAHFGVNLASYAGDQTVQYLHDWWLENATSPGVANNTMSLLAAEFTVSSGTPYTATPADAAGLTDASSATQAAARTQADTAGLTDTSTIAQAVVRTQADPAGLTDTQTAALGAVREQADPAGLTDATSTSLGLARTSADPAGVTDTASATATNVRTQADAAGLTDSATTTAATARTATDAAGLTDTATTTASAERSPADTLGATDQAAPTLTADRTQADTLGLTDVVEAVLTGAGSAAADDTAGLTDSVMAVLDRVVTVADLLDVIDEATAAAAAAVTVEVADTAGISDAVTVELAAVRDVADLLGLLDGALTEVPVALTPEWTLYVPADDLTVHVPRDDLTLHVPADDLTLTARRTP